MIGRTVARIEESPTDPKYGHTSDDTILIHFTDGTALRVSGHSYEDVSLSYAEESHAELRARLNAAVGRREKERLARLQRAEWLSISCDERAARKAKADTKLSKTGLLMRAEMHDALLGYLIDQSRMLFGGPSTVRLRCKKCGERQCPNATTKTCSAESYKPDNWSWSTFTIPVKPTDD